MAKNEAKIKFTAETGEFNESIKQANSEMSKLKAELKLNEAQMENTGESTEGLKKKHSLLEAQLKASQSKTEALSQKVEKAAEIYGENSAEVTKLKTQLANAQTAEEKIKREINACNKELDEQSDEFEDAEKSAGKFGETLKNVGGVITKGVVAGFGAATAAVGALVKSSIDAYADYEQLVGGVDTLFKDSSSKVQEYAANAYKTAGMSANDYMETVTGFSASLLQSLDGDTAKTAEKANMAITDMSDNANKMGTDLESLKTAYGGFAKGQYNMLDNLKLGYGGTQEEMKRLLEDASAISGVKYDISSYADVVDAIHVIQTEMGITGTTAKEASTTIAGSISSMKSSWANLTTAIASDDLPFDEYVNNFVDSFTTVTNNLIPRISVALNGVVKLVDQLAPVIISKIPELFSQLFPSIIEAATGLFQSIVSILPSLIGTFVTSVIPQFLSGLTDIINSIIEALPAVIQSIVSALPTLIPMIINAVVSIIVTICEQFSSIIQPIIDYLPAIIISIVTALMNNLPALIQGVIQLVLGIVDAIPQIITSLIDVLPQVIAMIVTGLLSCLPDLIMGAIQLVMGIVKALPQILSSLIKALPNALKGIWNGIKNVFAPVGDWFGEKFKDAKEKASNAWSDAKAKFSNTWSNIKGAFSNVGGWFKDQFSQGKENAKTAWSNAKTIFAAIYKGIQRVFSNVGGWFKEKFSAAKNNVQTAWSTVKNFFANIKNGIVNAFSNIKEKLTAPFTKARDAIKSVADKIKGFFKGEISMPKIKLPHFGITPKGWKVGDLLDGSIPKLKIDWYADGGIMTRPTIFGMNGSRLMAGGEAGYEAILPIDRLQDYVSNAVERSMQALNIQALAQAVEDLANRPIELNINGRQFALATASDSDSVSGVRTTLKSRGLIVD